MFKSVVLILTICSLGCWGCSKSPSDKAQVKLQGINRILIFGDSIAAGNHTDTNYGIYLGGQTSLPVINLAVGGTTLVSDQQYGQIMSTTFQKGDLVFFTPGINDISLHWGDSTYWTQYQTDLDQIVSRITNAGAILVLGTTLHTLNQLIPDSEVQVVGDIVRTEVTQKNLPNLLLFDGFNLFTPDSENMISDDVHPNNLGETQLGQIYVNFLIKNLK